MRVLPPSSIKYNLHDAIKSMDEIRIASNSNITFGIEMIVWMWIHVWGEFPKQNDMAFKRNLSMRVCLLAFAHERDLLIQLL